MSITEASNGSAAAPAVGRPVTETAENVEEKSAVEDPSKEADKVSIHHFIKILWYESRLWFIGQM